MDFFDKVHERLRDHTRDDICARLRSLGIDAQIAERDRTEERIGCGNRRTYPFQVDMRSLGLIDIAEGPIRWVNVLRSASSPSSGTVYRTDYGVPDPRLGPRMTGYIPNLQIKSVRNVSVLRWKGKDSDRGIINRLNSDISIKHPIMENRDVIIRADGYHKCWIIQVETREVPSKELWNCYQAIADHLLADWPPA